MTTRRISRMKIEGVLTIMFLAGVSFTLPRVLVGQDAETPLAVPNPHYVTLTRAIDVNAPIDKVWARVGDFCAITEWMNSPEWADCRYLKGSGGPGSVRSIVDEVVVGETQYSYTYAQAPRVNTPYNFARVTLAAEPLTAATTSLSFTLLEDNSVYPDDAARQKDLDRRAELYVKWLANMKLLAEGGTLPPKPAGTLRPPVATPYLNPAPHYVSLPLSIAVDAPIDKVWPRVGKTCDIGEWGFQTCEVIAGKAGELGVVRSTGHSIIVAQGRYSYTYAQPLRATGLFPMYHGTLEARPTEAGRTTLYYTLVWDDSTLPDDAARQKQMEDRRLLFNKMLRNMKKLSEGGTLTAEDKRSPVAS